MKAFFALCVALVVFGACNTQSAVFTPDPKAYPCHRADGSADPNAVDCRPFDGSHTCCPENFRCGTLDGQPNCEFMGDPDWTTNTFEARQRMTEARTEQP